MTGEAILDFLNGDGALTATWVLKHRVLTGLYRFAVSHGHVDSSPLPITLPKLPPQQTPYVYSTEELRRLLDATAILHTGRSRHVPAMYRTLLLLLYGTGMRIGEALRLTLQDVDLAERTITVRCTKFFKTRLVPIGPKLADELAAHLERRSLLPMPLGREAPLFASRGVRGGAIRASSRCSSMCDELPVSIAPSANRARRACMIFATPPQCTVSSRGIAPARTSGDCSRSSRPTSVTSISDRPSATSK
ncbi:tyrosine-type recombinase/integrase [Labrys sp. 22185]|uniref:tyrosine-type recombinase/integrase n=1 Tax=Labrys sp. 22185 TaxID=3453888 RepID=UPI003F85183F